MTAPRVGPEVTPLTDEELCDIYRRHFPTSQSDAIILDAERELIGFVRDVLWESQRAALSASSSATGEREVSDERLSVAVDAAMVATARPHLQAAALAGQQSFATRLQNVLTNYRIPPHERVRIAGEMVEEVLGQSPAPDAGGGE